MKTLRPDIDLTSREHLQGELDHLRAHMREAEDTLRAIQEGEVDALVVSEREGEKVYILRSPDRTYRLMIEEMRQGAVTVTPDGTILYANGCFADILRTSAQSLVGSRVRSFVARNSFDLLEALLGQQGKAQGEVELVAGDGTRIPVFVAVSQLSLEEEQPVLCLVVTDLTDQKHSEKLVADEELARSVLDHAAEAMVVCDTEGRIVRANQEAHRLCGRNVLLERFEEAFPLEMVPGSMSSSAESPDARAFVARVLAGDRLRGVEAGLDGGRLDLMLSAGPLRPAGRKAIEGCVVTLTDITERRRSERELQRAWAAAEAMNQAKDHFLATLSHELRTPLTPVLAVISGLESNEGFPPDLHQSVVMMRRNIELEARLIDDLLDLTRVSRGKLELERRNVDLRELLEHAVQTSCGEEMSYGRRRIVVDLQNGDLRLWGDASRLTQVFWNLLNNAVKFTPEGGTITVRSRYEASTGIAVEISDTGVGIDPGVLPRIFDAFEQGEVSVTRRFGGLGLGLAISKAIVELHGGTIDVRSSGKDRGTTFEVRLPTGTLQLEAEGAAQFREGTPFGPVRVARNLRILLVEDHPDTADALAELLRTRGHVVRIATTVAQALAAAGEERFDLVLSDLGLPDGSGQDLMRQLSHRYQLRGIALSGYGMEDDIRRSRDAGFHCHLTKPVNLQALETAIQQVAEKEPAEV